MRSLLVLAGVLSVALLACSDAAPAFSTGAPSADAATPPTSTEGASDAGAARDVGASADAKPQPTGTCPSAIGTFDESEYLHALHPLQKGSCSPADLDTLEKIGLGSYAARRALVSATCAKCVYSDVNDAEWGLLVVVDPDTALTNYAGCAALAGDVRPCVKMNSAWRFCTRKACGHCSGAQKNACAEAESTSGQCQSYFEADTACGGAWPAGCSSSDEMIATYCGP